MYIIVNGSLVYFSWGLFLRQDLYTWVLGWSSNRNSVTGQVSIQVKIATWHMKEFGYWIGYSLRYLELKRVSNETIWQCSDLWMENSITSWLLTNPDLQLYVITCGIRHTGVKLSKMVSNSTMYVASLCRVNPLKDIV